MEEKLNAITHGIGALLALVGLVILSVSAGLRGNIWHVVSFNIFGASLFLLYLFSTLYHSFTNAEVKYVFKIFDHAAIFLLIAGTYTPFALVLLHGVLGWTVFGVIWGLALCGVIFTIFFVGRFKVLSTMCYIAMGWFIVLLIKPLMAALSVAGLSWLIAGGLFYTVGTVFYLYRRMPYNHTVWHLFVLAGSASHFVTVLRYVLPIPVAYLR
jgi:hemolysin III